MAETAESEEEDENEELEPEPSNIASIEDAVAVASNLLSYVSESGLEDTAEHLTYVVASLQRAQIRIKVHNLASCSTSIKCTSIM